uniref:Uncharacterized protein n=1 Tax=Cereibacter sphaeroides (strain ATCC 17025 / ATH 2.4.3) TaxID=349102 RepID=A4WSA5_CERS5
MHLANALCAALLEHLEGGPARPPEAGLVLWNAFIALSRARRYSGGGPDALAFSEIAAWCALMRTPLLPEHVEILTQMDAVWLAHAYNERRRAPDGVKALPPVSKHGLTAQLFDVTVA